jgi:hypothetical protein
LPPAFDFFRALGIIDAIETQTIVSADADTMAFSAWVLGWVAQQTDDFEELYLVGGLLFNYLTVSDHHRAKSIAIDGLKHIIDRSAEFRRHCVLEEQLCRRLVAEIAWEQDRLLDRALWIVRTIVGCGGDDELACAVDAGIIECILGQPRFFDVTVQQGPDTDTFILCCEILAWLARRVNPVICEKLREEQFIQKVISVLGEGFNAARSSVPMIVLAVLQGSNRQLISEFAANDGIAVLVDLFDASSPEAASQIIEILDGFLTLLPGGDALLADATVVDALNRVLEASRDDSLIAQCEAVLARIEA